jgi:hypothetical protein
MYNLTPCQICFDSVSNNCKKRNSEPKMACFGYSVAAPLSYYRVLIQSPFLLRWGVTAVWASLTE